MPGSMVVDLEDVVLSKDGDDSRFVGYLALEVPYYNNYYTI